ncbi:MAG: hypothetical protein COT26_03020 [Candidatus Kerfeldbacteria bacterium CG08_land_8_20_14_0_20_43_14]|uniref:DUF192 domain-containing protein n=1 Tax=Candidatus Kerfeldbacteria bacterium CG08_land_8_20_14_0_20_43_14 TaxID=2014246 RepID=A0A2H0YPW8_9BACT|nr:MAG: hypothetical protein COT26_03020 [Candidatus Kerfeldbacteria bacterium CG08_land_8_20_14_0_20_43_14]
MNKSLSTFVIVGVLLIALAWAVGGHEISDYTPYYFQRILGKSAKVENRGQVFKVEVARSDRAKAKGLSNRKKLPREKGMLFVFDKPGIYEFWMKDMLVPLDIVWINGSKIVDISRSVSPPAKNAEPPKVQPKSPVQYVLEVYAGAASSWQIGDSVDITFDKWF